MVSTRLPKPELWAISLLLSVVIIAVVNYVRILQAYFVLFKKKISLKITEMEENGSSCFAKHFWQDQIFVNQPFFLTKELFSASKLVIQFFISKIRIKIKLLLHSAFQEKCLTENYRFAARWFSTTLLSILRDVPGLPYHMIRYKSKTSLVISYETI